MRKKDSSYEIAPLIIENFYRNIKTIVNLDYINCNNSSIVDDGISSSSIRSASCILISSEILVLQNSFFLDIFSIISSNALNILSKNVTLIEN
jgi:hypothetical protein